MYRTITTTFALVILEMASPLSGETVAQIQVDVSSYKFQPPTIVLEHNRAYVLHFVNHSGGSHDFTAKAFFEAADVAQNDRSKIANGRIELEGDSQKDIQIISPPIGHYKFRCSHFMHTMFGMKGEIIVQ